jgi:hypothetical protein
MSDIAPFIAVLESAQKKESKITEDVQQAAEGIDIDALKAAYEKVAEQGEFESVDAAEKDVLNKAFEFAAKAVMLLKTSPGLLEKKDLYIYFKVSKGEVMEKPGMMDFQVCDIILEGEGLERVGGGAQSIMHTRPTRRRPRDMNRG